MLHRVNKTAFLLVFVMIPAVARSQSIEQEFEFAGSIADSILEFTVEPFDNQGNTRQLTSVSFEYDGSIDMKVLITNYTTLDLQPEEWAYDFGANMIVAFDEKPGYEDGGPFYGLGGIYEAGITGVLSAGSGGPPPPFGNPTPGDVTVSAEVGNSFFSELETTFDLSYFISDEPLQAKIAPFQDLVVSPPAAEPSGFIDGMATALDFSGDLVITYNWVEGSTRPEDCNGDGSVDIEDLRCVCSATTTSLDNVLSELDLFAGDLDGDGDVAFADFLILSDGFGDEGTYLDGDLDCDGEVGFSDFLVLSFNFGQTNQEIAAVPEPSLWAFLPAMLSLTMLRKRRRSHNVRTRTGCPTRSAFGRV